MNEDEITQHHESIDYNVNNDNEVSLVFNVPHLFRNDTQNNTIPIDWINVTVYKPGIFDK